ncbi:MAG: hypothetical protein PUG48_00465 [Clostridia bacterium]|nr:hypothetical protein [Clostridia bacterium]
MVEINSGYAKVTLVGANEIGCRNPNRYASIYVAVDATIEFTSESSGSLNVYNSTNSVNGNNASAATITQNTPEPKTTDAVITTSIKPTYTVTIPADVAVAFNVETTNFGQIKVLLRLPKNI